MTETALEPKSKPTSAEFWFDPVCPFTWRTSRWLVDVADRLGVGVTWQLMSLAVLRQGSFPASDGGGEVSESIAPLRALAAAEEHGGQPALATLYTLLGARKHDAGQPMTPASVRQAVADAGLPATVGDAVDGPAYDERIIESHERGQQRGGMDMGSPVLALDGGQGYFGPVVTEIPRGDDAVRLFEAIRLLATVPAFSELKTSRS